MRAVVHSGMATEAPEDVCEHEHPASPWFDEGNILIRAEGDLFKAYKRILTQQSELFSDLLALPQPADAEVLDGCYVVQLEGASKKEISLFLRCLHDPAEYVFL